MNNNQSSMGDSQFLIFYLAGEQYAIGLSYVKEIISYSIVTKLPQAPNFILGVINLRGNVVAIADLALKFGLTARPITDRSCVMIVEIAAGGESTVMGIVADSVNRVIDIAAPDILPAPRFGTCVAMEFIRGIVKADDKFLLILDIDKALSVTDMSNAHSAAPGKTVARVIE